MFDFCLIISKNNIKFKPNKLHADFIINVQYIRKQVVGKLFDCEYFSHTDVPEDGSTQVGDKYCALIGKAYTNKDYHDTFLQSPSQLSAAKLIELYDQHGKSFIQYVKGIFVAIICDEVSNTYLAYTSKSGLYRLYYAIESDRFVVSSSLSSILHNLSSPPALDEVALIQHGIFDYPLGDRTIYQGIKTLDNSCFLEYSHKTIELHKYFSSQTLIQYHPTYTWKQTNQQLPIEFNKAMDNILLGVGKFNSALTGGYDSRTVLSYLLKRKIPGCRLYTWAASKDWEEMSVAGYIAEKLGLEYLPVELGKEMLDAYEEYSDKQIYWSDGSGSINRCNQMYAHSILAQYSRDLITGYFGSELFRPLHRANVEFKGILIELLLSANRKSLLEKAFDNMVLTGLNRELVLSNKKAFIDSTLEYFRSLDLTEYKQINLLLFIIYSGFWKFLGQEFHSQRINNKMTSPFMDDDFISFILQTPIVNIHRGAYGRRGYLAYKGQAIYHPILKENYPQLMKFNTDRGFAPQDYESVLGPINVFLKHYLSHKRQIKGGIKGFNSILWNRSTYEQRESILNYQDAFFNSIKANDPSAGLWYSVKWYLNLMR